MERVTYVVHHALTLCRIDICDLNSIPFKEEIKGKH